MLAGGDHEIIRLVLLQHHPLHADIILGVAPVAQRVDIAHVKTVLDALHDIGKATGDLAGHKGLAPAWAFMVEQNAVAGIHAIGLAVIDRDPMGIKLGYRIGRARVKRGCLGLRGLLHQAVKL